MKGFYMDKVITKVEADKKKTEKEIAFQQRQKAYKEKQLHLEGK